MGPILQWRLFSPTLRMVYNKVRVTAQLGNVSTPTFDENSLGHARPDEGGCFTMLTDLYPEL